MMMMVKLCVILGLMGVVAGVLTRLFPADESKDAPRTLNDLMREVDLDEEPDAVRFAEEEAGAEAAEEEDVAEAGEAETEAEAEAEDAAETAEADAQTAEE